MAHVSTTEMTHEEWMATRKDTIGSSDVGAILGISGYDTPRDIYNKKKGLMPEFEGNNNTEWGTELEDFCALMFERKEMGFGTNLLNGQIRRDNKIRMHPMAPWATCNLDRLIIGSNQGGGKPIILELKTTTSFAMKAWDAVVPTSYFAQVQWQMFVTGYNVAIIWVAVLDKKQFVRLNVERSQEFIDAMTLEVTKFKQALDAGDPTPLAMLLPDMEKIRPVEGSRVEATDEIATKINQLTEVKSKKSELEKTEKLIATEIKTFIGVNEVLAQGDRVLATLKMQHKDGYAAPAVDFRVLNLQREKKVKEKK